MQQTLAYELLMSSFLTMEHVTCSVPEHGLLPSPGHGSNSQCVRTMTNQSRQILHLWSTNPPELLLIPYHKVTWMCRYKRIWFFVLISANLTSEQGKEANTKFDLRGAGKGLSQTPHPPQNLSPPRGYCPISNATLGEYLHFKAW